MDPMTIKVLLDNHRTACAATTEAFEAFSNRQSQFWMSVIPIEASWEILWAKPYVITGDPTSKRIAAAHPRLNYTQYFKIKTAIFAKKMRLVSMILKAIPHHLRVAQNIENKYTPEQYKAVGNAIALCMTALRVSQQHPEHFRFEDHPTAITGRLRFYLTLWCAMHNVPLELPLDCAVDILLDIATKTVKQFKAQTLINEWEAIQQSHQQLMAQLQA